MNNIARELLKIARDLTAGSEGGITSYELWKGRIESVRKGIEKAWEKEAKAAQKELSKYKGMHAWQYTIPGDKGYYKGVVKDFKVYFSGTMAGATMKVVMTTDKNKVTLGMLGEENWGLEFTKEGPKYSWSNTKEVGKPLTASLRARVPRELEQYMRKFVRSLERNWETGGVKLQLSTMPMIKSRGDFVYEVKVGDSATKWVGMDDQGRIGEYNFRNGVSRPDKPERLAERLGEFLYLDAKGSSSRGDVDGFVKSIEGLGFRKDGREWVMRNRDVAYEDYEPEGDLDDWYDMMTGKYNDWAGPIERKVEVLMKRHGVDAEIGGDAQYGTLTVELD